MRPHSEYRLIMDAYSPEGHPPSTPNWHHFELAPAAFQIIRTNDEWHNFFTKHFRPHNRHKAWAVGLPSNGILPVKLPSTRLGDQYQRNTGLRLTPNKRDADYQRPVRRIILSTLRHLC